MYVVTFYSFKGGVGRTMALANVGVDLARRGYRVLLVDFDLEAPGLDTLNLSHPPKPVPGLLDFVHSFIQDAETPAFEEHVYEVTAVGGDGRLWVMPAGRDDEGYSERLAGIDWQKLYVEHDGYVMFEDLKLQWEQHLAPDYVLIDSRTGHGDVGGICTRQLPDAVVTLFFPNEQNRRGLQKVVRDIRSEITRTGKPIDLHFVMSNVPDLDDEDGILSAEIKKFSTSLLIEPNRLLTIHRYDHIGLVRQDLFSLTKPKSRLAREYHSLTKQISSLNPNDRAGALGFISDLNTPGAAPDLTFSSIATKLNRIHASHPDDHEILLTLARYRMRLRQIDEALVLLDEASALEPVRSHLAPEIYMRRAECRNLTGDKDGAVEDLERVLESSGAEWTEVARAVRMQREIAPELTSRLAGRPAVKGLHPMMQLEIVSDLNTSADELEVARVVISRLLEGDAFEGQAVLSANRALGLILIGQGKYAAALELLMPIVANHDDHIASVFNHAIALWGVQGDPPLERFSEVLRLDQEGGVRRHDANYFQCLAVTASVSNDAGLAAQFLRRSRTALATRRVSTVSCSTFMTVRPDVFLSHLDEMEKALPGVIVPNVLVSAGRVEEISQ